MEHVELQMLNARHSKIETRPAGVYVCTSVQFKTSLSGRVMLCPHRCQCGCQDVCVRHIRVVMSVSV